MNQFDARKSIAQAFITAWPTLSGNIPYTIDKDPSAPTAPYARLEINFDGGEVWSLGGPGNQKNRDSGLIVVTFWSPPGSGLGQLDLYCEMARTMFERKRIGNAGNEEGITTFAMVPGRVFDDGEFAMMSVGIDFEYYYVR